MIPFQTKLLWLVFTKIIISPSLFSVEVCPKVCVPCLEHLISCTFGGLDEIPQDLYVDTKKVTLSGHTFSQSSLSRQNFSRFSKPKYAIEQLSIRRSNIQLIKSLAFFDLSGLDTLDLSDNLKLMIEERAFANLKLKYLRLDLIGNLILAPTAFDGLLVASLSIKTSRLQNFPFSLLEPLSKDLRNLFLSNNNIQSLSPKFEALFRQLTVLDLHDNPLICSCGLLWLSTTLRWRQQYLNIQSESFSEVQNPKCSGPYYLKDEYIDKVPDSEFDCQPPKLERIEIRFQSFHKAILRCAATMQSKRAPLNISWSYVNDRETFSPTAIESQGPNEASIAISRRHSLDRFMCSMYSDSGNVSVKVHLNWPSERQVKTAMNISRHKNSLDLNISKKPSDYNQNFFFKEQYTLLELLGSVIGTFIITMFLFIVIYRFYFYKAIKLKKEQMKKSGYATYEVGLYSDSQTYDIPQYPSFDHRNKMFRPIFVMPQSNKPLVDYSSDKIL